MKSPIRIPKRHDIDSCIAILRISEESENGWARVEEIYEGGDSPKQYSSLGCFSKPPDMVKFT